MATPRRASQRLHYSDDDRTFALRWLLLRRGQVAQTARELEIPVQTLWQWARGKRMWGLISRDQTRPLKNLYAFRGRRLPLLVRGETVAVDISVLTGREFATFLSLLEKTRIESEEKTKTPLQELE